MPARPAHARGVTRPAASPKPLNASGPPDRRRLNACSLPDGVTPSGVARCAVRRESPALGSGTLRKIVTYYRYVSFSYVL